jgi:hypothetical protein
MPDQPPLPEPPPSAETVERAAVATEPGPPRRWPIVLAATSIGLILIGVTVLMAWAFAGSVGCPDGSFESGRFGYCVTVPEGWTAIGSETDAQPFDLFQDDAGGATITISAVPLDPGEDLDGFASAMRGLDESAGYEVADPSDVRVAGEPALRIDLSAATGISVDPTRGREVVFIRDGVGWRVQMGETPEGFDDTAKLLDVMLAGWVFV